MSHWIRVKKTVAARDQKKNFGVGSGLIEVSSRVKVRSKIKMAEDGGGSQKFLEACVKAEIPPTRRQLSKWNNGRGKARIA